MKILALIFTLIVFSLGSVYAQVTIGANSEPKATLDVVSDPTSPLPNGLLIPRMTGNEVLALPVTADQNSLLVYVTKNSDSTVVAGTSSPVKYYMPKIYQIGYWYYDNTDTTWKPLGPSYRRKEVYVRNDGVTGDYTTLQEAYNAEAKKLYTPTSTFGAGYKLVAFWCYGDVGPLNADGAIPSIRIQGPSASNPAILGDLDLVNTSVTFGSGVSTGYLKMTNSYGILNFGGTYSFGDVTLNKSLLDVKNVNNTMRSITLNQGTVNISPPNSVLNILPTTSGTDGITLQAGSSFRAVMSTVINFQGSAGVQNCVLAEDGSIWNVQGIMNINTPVAEAVILSRQFSSMTIGTIVSAQVPKNLFYAITGGKIQHYRGYIQVTTSQASFISSNGGFILLGGDKVGYLGDDTSTLYHSTINGSTAHTALRANGGDIRIAPQPSTSGSTYYFNNYKHLAFASGGGSIYLQNRVVSTNVTIPYNPTTTGTPNSSGSVIYVDTDIY